jgi:hypothetical protein
VGWMSMGSTYTLTIRYTGHVVCHDYSSSVLLLHNSFY